MTVSTIANSQAFAANGVTTVFPFTFKALDPADIKVVTVTADGVETEIVANITVALTPSGGSVTFNSPPASGLTVFIRSDRPYAQASDIKNQGSYRPDSNEEAIDSVAILVKQLLWDINRCLKLPEHEDGSLSTILANAVQRAGAMLGFDGAGAFKLVQGGAIASPDVMWAQAGQVVTDANDNFFIHQVRRFEGFIGFDVTAVTAPTGLPIIVDWELNGVVQPSWRVTLAVGQKYAETLIAVSTSINDKIRPRIVQAGNLEPGRTLCMRMRGL